MISGGMMKNQKSENGFEQAWSALGEALPLAVRTLADLLGAQDERVRLRASMAILNRAGIPEAQPVEHIYAIAKLLGLGSSDSGKRG